MNVEIGPPYNSIPWTNSNNDCTIEDSAGTVTFDRVTFSPAFTFSNCRFSIFPQPSPRPKNIEQIESELESSSEGF